MYEIVKYEQEHESEWDEFISRDSINGTFLQTRRFLNYHPKSRFKDASFLVYNVKKQIVAVCPGCVVYEEGKKVFFSHRGSTYGGIVISEKCYKVDKIVPLIEVVEKYLIENGYEKVVYKMTPRMFSKTDTSLLEYALYCRDYAEEKELNLQIEFETYKEGILSNFAQGKRTNVNNCLKQGFEVRKLHTESEIREFYSILERTLEKYSLKPVHTAEELIEFMTVRLCHETSFWGIFDKERMIAGSMMFLFRNVGVAHSQYLAALPEYNQISISTYLYYCMIVEMKKMGMDKISWGIASVHGTKEINVGLAKSKERYGSNYSLNRIFIKTLV